MPFSDGLPRQSFEAIVKLALNEDLGRAGDVTSEATLPPEREYTYQLNTREPGVLAGLDPALLALEMVDPDIKCELSKGDGDVLATSDLVAVITGRARSILTAERTVLNFLGRLSGVASLTARYVAEVAHTKAKIVCTRKTTPGLRALEKQAIRLGGGVNHRFGLDDAILIKDNHIAAAGSITEALEKAQAKAAHLMAIEIEVDTLEQLDAIIPLKPDVVLLDNMPTTMLKEAVTRVNGAFKTEASGGVNLQTVKAIAETGVDAISVGALTHSATVLDLGLDQG